MIGPQLATEVKKRIEAAETPVLSLYLDVNPANPENERRGFIIRAKDAMREAGVPKELAREVEEQLSRSETKPEGRTLVMFLSEDRRSVSEHFHLQADLPLLGPIRGVIARWGEPHLTPLMLALGYHHRYGIVHITSKSWRFFETYLGEIEERRDAFRELDLSEWRDLSEDAVGAPDVPARGGQGKEKFERRMQEQTHRLYNQAAGVLDGHMRNGDLRRLVVLGPSAQTSEFIETLPKHLADAVVGSGRNLELAQPSEHQVLSAAAPIIREYESREEQELLEQIRERGISGRHDVIGALQAGRLHVLALPWESPDLDQELYSCAADGAIYADKEAARTACNGEGVETVRLGDAVPEVVAANGTQLTFLVGEGRQDLIDNFGGVAGLPRW
jgi:peptide subunit release factor 1 (eRF1)